MLFLFSGVYDSPTGLWLRQTPRVVAVLETLTAQSPTAFTDRPLSPVVRGLSTCTAPGSMTNCQSLLARYLPNDKDMLDMPDVYRRRQQSSSRHSVPAKRVNHPSTWNGSEQASSRPRSQFFPSRVGDASCSPSALIGQGRGCRGTPQREVEGLSLRHPSADRTARKSRPGRSHLRFLLFAQYPRTLTQRAPWRSPS